MIGRRATVGLALLSALLFSAIAVQSASAAANNTTLFTCVKTDDKSSTFEDAHCDKDSATKTGNFEHKELTSKIGETTEVEFSNDTTGTKSLQTFKALGLQFHIECTALAGTGSVGNTEPKAKEHKISGKATLNYTGCTVKEPKECKVKEPIVATIDSIEGVEGIEGPNKESNAMGISYKAETGKPFITFSFEDSCSLKSLSLPIEGSVVGTSGPGTSEKQTNKWHGATSIFTAAMSSLPFLGKPLGYTGNTTVRMKGGGNPIVATTVT